MKASSDCPWRTARHPSNLPTGPSRSPSPTRPFGYGDTGVGCEARSIGPRCAWAGKHHASNGRKRRLKLPRSSMLSSSRRPSSKKGAGPGDRGVCDLEATSLTQSAAAETPYGNEVDLLNLKLHMKGKFVGQTPRTDA